MSKSLPGEETDTSTKPDGNKVPASQLLRIRLRDTARERFWSSHDKGEYFCPGCGRSDVPMDVHHRDGDPFNNHMVNLIGVCRLCHKAEHRRRSTTDRVSEWKESLPTG